MKKKAKSANQYRIIEQYNRRYPEPKYYTIQGLYIDSRGNAEWKTLGEYKLAGCMDTYFSDCQFATIELAKQDIEKRIKQYGFAPKVVMEINGAKK